MSDFNAKILLFGEYGIIKGSKGLALPLTNFKGCLDFSENHKNLSSKLRLDEFYAYLKDSNLISREMDLPKLENDIKKGLFFNSNIPHGYGIGSSGALCASLFAKYAYHFERKSSYNKDELSYLKDIMSLMESFYHGTSSGIDCLISLIDLPMLIESRSNVKIISDPLGNMQGSFFLFDSGASRTTSTFVQNFLEQYEKEIEYKNKVIEFVEVTNSIISKTIANKCIESDFYKLSRMQYLYFSNMIPKKLKNIWLEGIESKKYFMKLCGAGGGGYFIVYTQDQETEKQFLNDENYMIINHG